MLNNKVNEENGQQPCVVFESVKAWLGTAENLRYIDNNSNPFYVRDWKIMNYDPYNSSEGKGFDIFFHTTVFFRDVEPDSDQPSHTVVTIVDDGFEWLSLIPI